MRARAAITWSKRYAASASAMSCKAWGKFRRTSCAGNRSTVMRTAASTRSRRSMAREMTTRVGHRLSVLTQVLLARGAVGVLALSACLLAACCYTPPARSVAPQFLERSAPEPRRLTDPPTSDDVVVRVERGASWPTFGHLLVRGVPCLCRTRARGGIRQHGLRTAVMGASRGSAADYLFVPCLRGRENPRVSTSKIVALGGW